MTQKPRNLYCWIALTWACSCAASGDDPAATPSATTTVTGNNQPSSSAGGRNGSGGSTVNPGAAVNTGSLPASGGTNGSAEAPAMGAGLVNMGVMGSANAGSGGAGGAGPNPICTGDADADGIRDCNDGCPADPNKLEAGACGCGVLDADIDFDGTLDCQDMCPGDPGKVAPGVCGCGLADTDLDTDGVLDCNDGCPSDATRVAPGACGCGAPDTLAFCLRHRYSFNGMGAVATDSVGDADGDIIGATLAGNGTLVLAGVASNQYVELPAGIISTLGVSATLEAWVTWTGGGAPWQRVFDFGSSDQPTGEQGTGVTYLFLTPSNTINPNLRVAYTNEGPGLERVVNGVAPLPAAAVQVAVVINGPAQTLTLYQNGALIGTTPTANTTLQSMNDVNNWLGRSQFAADEEFQGVLDEVRIYSVARSAAQIAADVAAGPNNLPPQ